MRDTTVRHVVVGTAGPIDHGKTSLVKALTGMGGFVEVVGSPWLAITILASIVAFYASARKPGGSADRGRRALRGGGDSGQRE